MATKKEITTTKIVDPYIKVNELKLKLSGIRLEIKAGKNTNTNAHRALTKEIAQLLTKINTK